MIRAAALLAVASLLACSNRATRPTDAAALDGPVLDATTLDLFGFDLAGDHAVTATVFCDLPGSIQTTANGTVIVPGGRPAPDLGFLRLPAGFCVHYFAGVGNVRQMRFAPGGELFVASPTAPTTGGGPGGMAAIVALPDDDRDGVADSTIEFLGSLPKTVGLLFTATHLYYQDATRIMRVPYRAGDRAPSGASEQVADITVFISNGHWPKTLDAADDGRIYVGNGSDQGESCDPAHPFHGGILALDGSPGGKPIARGLRNPIAVRCQRGHDLCFATELAKDYSALQGGREKLLPIREGDDWGYPCCATKNLPYLDVMPVPDCSAVTSEGASFLIGDTPFGIDFEAGRWAAPWTGRAFIPLHGAYGSWHGARLTTVAMDATTGLPVPATDVNGMNTGSLRDFATGWDDGTFSHGRPAAITFAPDGRLFLGNDANGIIVWIAPLDLRG